MTSPITPEQSSSNNHSISTLTANTESSQSLNQDGKQCKLDELDDNVSHPKKESIHQSDVSPNLIKDSDQGAKNESSSNEISKTSPTKEISPEMTENYNIKEKNDAQPDFKSLNNNNESKENNRQIRNATIDNDNDETLGSGSGNDIKSQESLKLKLIDVVLPEDITSSQRNFIFQYEESLRSSQANLEEVRRSQNVLMNSGKNDTNLEKKLFKKKYEHTPSKLGEPMNINGNKRIEDYVIERIPLKKGDSYSDEDIGTNLNKFSHLAIGSTELLHEKLKH